MEAFSHNRARDISFANLRNLEVFNGEQNLISDVEDIRENLMRNDTDMNMIHHEH